ncbi:endonuclease/exonuclease/phosphatase family protein [Vibrio amylolyticus]|uniref:endonuclease/exonuclease/phosphatase family protein n=1 Tax=Vibrio amylolyticus TaxID=2847292 RepID=UPI003550E55B
MLINHLFRMVPFLLAIVSSSGFSASDLRFVTWNIKWLSGNSQSHIQQSHRSSQDFKKLNQYFIAMSVDVLAFQEVNDVEAIRRVVGKDYTIWLSERSWDNNKQHQFGGVNQYTGFAVHKTLAVTSVRDIKLEDTPKSKLRFGTYLLLNTINSEPVHLMSIHLKAGCNSGFRNTRNCQRLKVQGTELNRWIMDRQLDNDQYIVLGDFNSNLSATDSWMWEGISKGTSAILATRATKPLCEVRSKRNASNTFRYNSVIDHVVTSPNFHLVEAKQVLYKKEDVIDFVLSDHCPVLAVVNSKTGQ